MLNNWHCTVPWRAPAVLRAVLVRISSCELFPDVHVQPVSPVWIVQCIYSERRKLLLPLVAFPASGLFSQGRPLQVLCVWRKNEMGSISSQLHVASWPASAMHCYGLGWTGSRVRGLLLRELDLPLARVRASRTWGDQHLRAQECKIWGGIFLPSCF